MRGAGFSGYWWGQTTTGGAVTSNVTICVSSRATHRQVTCSVCGRDITTATAYGYRMRTPIAVPAEPPPRQEVEYRCSEACLLAPMRGWP